MDPETNVPETSESVEQAVTTDNSLSGAMDEVNEERNSGAQVPATDTSSVDNVVGAATISGDVIDIAPVTETAPAAAGEVGSGAKRIGRAVSDGSSGESRGLRYGGVAAAGAGRSEGHGRSRGQERDGQQSDGREQSEDHSRSDGQARSEAQTKEDLSEGGAAANGGIVGRINPAADNKVNEQKQGQESPSNAGSGEHSGTLQQRAGVESQAGEPGPHQRTPEEQAAERPLRRSDNQQPGPRLPFDSRNRLPIGQERSGRQR